MLGQPGLADPTHPCGWPLVGARLVRVGSDARASGDQRSFSVALPSLGDYTYIRQGPGLRPGARCPSLVLAMADRRRAGTPRRTVYPGYARGAGLGSAHLWSVLSAPGRVDSEIRSQEGRAVLSAHRDSHATLLALCHLLFALACGRRDEHRCCSLSGLPLSRPLVALVRPTYHACRQHLLDGPRHRETDLALSTEQPSIRSLASAGDSHPWPGLVRDHRRRSCEPRRNRQ